MPLHGIICLGIHINYYRNDIWAGTAFILKEVLNDTATYKQHILLSLIEKKMLDLVFLVETSGSRL